MMVPFQGTFIPMNTVARYLSILAFALFSLQGTGQEVKVYEYYDDLKPLLSRTNDTTYVVNFWATWCKPCVKEMPAFLALDKKFRDQKFRMILVSLDFETQVESKLKPYIRENDIAAEVVLLTDPKTHLWIDQVSADWSGSIPFTRIFNQEFEFFREGTLTFEELDQIITNNIIP